MRTARTIVLVMAVLLLSTGCSRAPEEPEPGPELVEVPARLGDVVVTEYEGEQLSALADFRENSIAGPQDVDIETYRLRVTGLVAEEQSYAYEDVSEAFPSYEKLVRLDCVEGWSVTILWQGVLLADIIDASGAEGDAQTVILRAADGYYTWVPLEYVRENDILLAYGMNGVPLPPERGFPFQLVAEQKWGYKWIKWVEEIELSDDPDPGGYWEDRGYSNSGDRDRPFYGN